jgi:hypothetical protein
VSRITLAVPEYYSGLLPTFAGELVVDGVLMASNRSTASMLPKEPGDYSPLRLGFNGLYALTSPASWVPRLMVRLNNAGGFAPR